MTGVWGGYVCNHDVVSVTLRFSSIWLLPFGGILLEPRTLSVFGPEFCDTEGGLPRAAGSKLPTQVQESLARVADTEEALTEGGSGRSVGPEPGPGPGRGGKRKCYFFVSLQMLGHCDITSKGGK